MTINTRNISTISVIFIVYRKKTPQYINMADTQAWYPFPNMAINWDVRKLKLASVHSGTLNCSSLYIWLKCKKLVKTSDFASKIFNFWQKAIW